MENRIGIPSSWKGTGTVDECIKLIDYGVLLTWRDMRTIKRGLSQEEQSQVVRHFVMRLCERHDERLAAEVLVESMLVWFANTISEELISAMINQLFEDQDVVRIIRSFVEISLCGELSEQAHEEVVFSTAVVLSCEVGLALQDALDHYPEQFSGGNETVDHITTYLLSVSNNNNQRIRLSLLHYFGQCSSSPAGMNSFNRVMARFGHTVLDHLFSLLFNKRTEAIALQYLLNNLPFVLRANNKTQVILQDIFKYYMLKKPERFSLFVQTFGNHLVNIEQFREEIQMTYLQHLGTLFHVVSDVNHKPLAKEIISCMIKYEQHPFFEPLMDRIIEEPTVRPMLKEVIQKVRNAGQKQEVIESHSQFRSSKRGRRPSFAKCDSIGPLGQITFLGDFDHTKVG